MAESTEFINNSWLPKGVAMAIFLTEIVVSAKTLTHISLEAFHEIEEMSRKITRGRNKGNQNIKWKLDKHKNKSRQNKAMMEGKKNIPSDILCLVELVSYSFVTWFFSMYMAIKWVVEGSG